MQGIWKPLKTGQKVWVQLTDQGAWKKATVCKTGDSPRSYYVRFEEGGTFRRNRIHIKSRQDPMVTDLHDGANCQVETSSISPSKNVPDSLADSQETTDPPYSGVSNTKARCHKQRRPGSGRADQPWKKGDGNSFWSSGETPNKVEFVEKKGDEMN
ncbi:hypothetical protein QYM36_005928 [Artemia franciscana]|uniref:Uncharacterized protein n=1 Tax=Artemia franciscana TaxID=6661 RepID=A0AA88LAA0_ARTSF|nr:hypothetical protein QYM36_005928 [Artemia franciscana]